MEKMEDESEEKSFLSNIIAVKKLGFKYPQLREFV
jgi:hypothetical protein